MQVWLWKKKMVRTADVKRGWGKFYSKSCKAIHQEKRTGQHKAYLQRSVPNEELEVLADGWGNPMFTEKEDREW